MALAARILAIANQKGGVGKTTTSLSLAAALHRQGRKALVMDLDPHACASIHLAFFPENLQYTAMDLFTGDGGAPGLWDKIIQPHAGGGFDFAPGHIRLSELETDLKETPNKGLILSRRLAQVRDRYDYVVLDCPPHMGVLLVNALVAADLLIIPIQTDFLALHGLRLMFDTIRMLNRVLSRTIKFRALATMYDRRAGACRRVLDLLRRKLGDKMFETVIDIDTQFREASAQGKVIFEVAPSSKGAQEYVRLAGEIERHEIS